MSMKICEEDHEAVIYEDYNYRIKKKKQCPVCIALVRNAVLLEELEELQKQIDAKEKE